MSPLTMALDVTIIALLIPTIVYAVILNRRLTALRSNREDLGKLITAFNEATSRVELGIPRLRKASEEVGLALDEHRARAQELRDDLAFMVERADSMADRLETAVREARGELKDFSGAAMPGVEAAAARATKTAAKPTVAAMGDMPPPARARSPLDVVALDGGAGIDDHERSQAEQELLRALQAAGAR